MERTWEQLRAENAYRKVQEVAHFDAKIQASYRSRAKSLPAMIISNGLGQATATLLAASKGKESDPPFLLFRHLEEWLCLDDPRAPYQGQDRLMLAITKTDVEYYLRAQRESIAWLDWLKKFCAAYLSDESEVG